MKLLYATTNKAEFDTMREALNGSEIELCGLNDFPSVGGASETGETALKNAVIKAKYYFDRLKVPLFSCDTALEITCRNRFGPGSTCAVSAENG